MDRRSKLAVVFASMVICGSLFGEGVGRTLEQDRGEPDKPKQDDVLHYRRGGKWQEKKVSEYIPFRAGKGGVLVEIPMGETGLHPLDAILVPYDTFSEHEDLLAFNRKKNIALLSWNRWNQAGLCLASPDADEILEKHGFKCSALDVVRLLRMTYR